MVTRVMGLVSAMASTVHPPTPAQKTVQLSYIGDTGAGRHIGSKQALIAQGWDPSVIDSAMGKLKCDMVRRFYRDPAQAS